LVFLGVLFLVSPWFRVLEGFSGCTSVLWFFEVVFPRPRGCAFSGVVLLCCLRFMVGRAVYTRGLSEDFFTDFAFLVYGLFFPVFLPRKLLLHHSRGCGSSCPPFLGCLPVPLLQPVLLTSQLFFSVFFFPFRLIFSAPRLHFIGPYVLNVSVSPPPLENQNPDDLLV